jgi:hypothetical protein
MTKLTGYFHTAMSYKSNFSGDGKSSSYSGKKSSSSGNSHGDDNSGFLGGGKPKGGNSHGDDNSGFLGGAKPKGGNSHGDDNSGFLGGGKPKGGNSHGGDNSGFLGGGKPKGDNSHGGSQPFEPQVITGTACNDTLQGNRYGSDILVGTTEVARGVGENDILIGGRARDTFVLGDAHGSFYLGQGNIDYAEIKNFNRCNDNIQLAGSIQDYSISYANGISSVFHKDACGCLDLVAQVNSACSPLDLNAHYFQYTPQSGGSLLLMG